MPRTFKAAASQIPLGQTPLPRHPTFSVDGTYAPHTYGFARSIHGVGIKRLQVTLRLLFKEVFGLTYVTTSRPKPLSAKKSTEQVVKDIRRATRRHVNAAL